MRNRLLGALTAALLLAASAGAVAAQKPFSVGPASAAPAIAMASPAEQRSASGALPLAGAWLPAAASPAGRSAGSAVPLRPAGGHCAGWYAHIQAQLDAHNRQCSAVTDPRQVAYCNQWADRINAEIADFNRRCG